MKRLANSQSRRAKLYIAKRGLADYIAISMKIGKDSANDRRLNLPTEQFELTRLLSCLREHGARGNPVESEAFDFGSLQQYHQLIESQVVVDRAMNEGRERQQPFQLLLSMFKGGVTQDVVKRLMKQHSDELLANAEKEEDADTLN